MTATYTFDDSIVSDLHKDAYGCRPRGDFWSRWTAASQDEKQAIWDDLIDCARETARLEKQREERQVELFEVRVLFTMESGAATRADAIRWIIQAEGMEDEYDMGYVCYCLGLPYSYEDEFRTVMKG